MMGFEWNMWTVTIDGACVLLRDRLDPTEDRVTSVWLASISWGVDLLHVATACPGSTR